MASDLLVSQTKDFIKLAMANTERVYRDSIIDISIEANLPTTQGGRMPVVTGKLRESICATSDAGSFTGSTGFTAAITQASPLSSIRVGWNAPYATAVEFGTGSTSPRAFARGATLGWQATVELNARKVNP
ncbi:MAG: hypothetical protein K0U41_05395 [Gammaproteobacteria bacterium]|nr:hypothetical protein [Gammaproteobacteria bacterium]